MKYSDYTAKVFGFRTFGKVYGLIICLAGLFNFSQSGLDALTHKTFNGDPRIVNIMLLTVAFVIGSGLVFYVTVRSQSLRRELLEDEAENANSVSLPSGTINGTNTRI